MLMKKLQNIIRSVVNNYIVQLISITVILLLIIFLMLETKQGNISFVYNNF